MIFETVSFHIVKPCNMKCKFCYATFEDMHVVEQLSFSDACIILTKLKDAGVKKITFAGGEPLLYKKIYDAIYYAKKIGLTTSIITNGSLLDEPLIKKFVGKLDWIGLSVDSTNYTTNVKIGRSSKRMPQYFELISNIKKYGFKLKINTVVNAFNKHEDMNEFISWAAPARWKVFQALKVDGQNDKEFDAIKVSQQEFRFFIERHAKQKSLVAEDNAAMTGSYLLISPKGELYENSKGYHTYSKPLQHNNIDDCLTEINLDRNMFIERGGIYNW